jgi:DNA polymerase-3 subunit delta'
MGGRKLIIIEPAETMNPNASNSLLKTLEEPVSNTIILLLTNKKQALLPTIRSRCQTIDFPLPERQSAAQWLEGTLMQNYLKDSPITEGMPLDASEKAKLLLSLASGAPLLALHLSQSVQLDARNMIIQYLLAIMNGSSEPVKIAEELFKQTKVKKKSAGRQSKSMSKNKSEQLSISAYDVVYWIDSIVADLARLAQNCEQDTITNTDFIENLQQLSHKLDLKKVLQLSDLINKAYFEIQGQININLLFEKLLIDWKNCKI